MLQRCKNIIRKWLYKVIKPPYVPASYSQAGEDAILRFLFNDYGLDRIRYLELGTNHPDSCNNTYLFYCKGSDGVCVEADVSLIENIKLKRPRDKAIHAGVSITDESEADFYVFNDPGINTFDPTEADRRSKSGRYSLQKVIKVPLVHVNDLIADNFCPYPDLLCVDIEGLDYAVLASLDFAKFPIPVVCVETCIYSENHIRPKNTAIAALMHTSGYEIYADTYINTIFVNKAWFYGSKPVDDHT